MSYVLPLDLVLNDEALREYLKTDWIIKTMLHLESTRKIAGYTQSDLATLLNTTQSVISRSESDMDGAISLRRYAEWLFACGAVPTRIETTTLVDARKDLIISTYGKNSGYISKAPTDNRANQSLVDSAPVLFSTTYGQESSDSPTKEPKKGVAA
ncbi:MAG: hypothetical protein C7B43_20010 [Sulfobacillus benefaciens]|uniref:HTH cro/C1-type domain-containing protein n=1 Tax=Sulfobacillus benefaciens TaxID=453960 RepID=A0A2T2WMI7_9FIRM|nr:MAG: hypothetical protein C7B43_20010 [Sulfobacillus benefaciens]HBQ95981.1 hypothetical protein [Sulfobacillus sp.]